MHSAMQLLDTKQIIELTALNSIRIQDGPQNPEHIFVEAPLQARKVSRLLAKHIVSQQKDCGQSLSQIKDIMHMYCKPQLPACITAILPTAPFCNFK